MSGPQQNNDHATQLPIVFFIVTTLAIAAISVAAIKFKQPENIQDRFAFFPTDLAPINNSQYQYSDQCQNNYVSINPYKNNRLYNAKPGHLFVSFTYGTTESMANTFLNNQGSTIRIESTLPPYVEYEFRIVRGTAAQYEAELKKQNFNPTIKTVVESGKNVSYITIRDHTIETSSEMNTFTNAHHPYDVVETSVNSFPLAYEVSVPIWQEGHWIQILEKDCHVDSVFKKSLIQ